jgi:hypothetical protein
MPITIKIVEIAKRSGLIIAIDRDGSYYLLWPANEFPELRVGDQMTSESWSTAPGAYIRPTVSRNIGEVSLIIEDWELSRTQVTDRIKRLG